MEKIIFCQLLGCKFFLGVFHDIISKGGRLYMKKINTKEFDERFEKLLDKEKLDINTIEQIMEEEIKDYRKELKYHLEELLSKKINEKELISKKNKNGKKKDTD